MSLLTFIRKNMFIYLFSDCFLNSARKSDPTRTEKPLTMEVSSRQFNPGENLPRTITLNYSARKTETEKRK